MLIDQLMPEYDFSEYHETPVNAGVDQTFAAIHDADFASNPTVRVLLAIRALPARIIGYRTSRSFSSEFTLRSVERFGFFITAESPPAEVVIALQGKFWTIRGGTECASREALNEPIAAGTARGVWNFSLRPTGAASCILATETRILCADAHARRSFRIYWFFVRPGSGIIRRMMLRTIRTLAESAA